MGSTRWIVLVALGAGTGCTRDNPAFGDGGSTGAPTDTGSTTKPPPTSMSDSDASGPQDSTGDAMTTDGATTDAPGTSTGAEETEGTEGTDQCPPFLDPLLVGVVPNLEVGTCEPQDPIAISVIEKLSDTEYAVRLCVGGVCPCLAGSEHTIFFDVPPPNLPPCGLLQLDLAEGDGMDCFIPGYTIRDAGGVLLQVVANDLDLAIPQPFDLSLGNEPVFECGMGCAPPWGFYDLHATVGPAVPIPPTGVPVDLPGPVGTFEVANEGSGIDEQCDPVIRWHATGAW